ncbi:DUF1748-domain-containing protein [Ramicandelaber brevisporus]|nr:DUF1748-domain-containing protein [Ramicandelaber brevisporus]
MIGRIAHYAVDAVLLSTALAGVRRSTGLQFNTEKIQSEDVRSIVNKYLAVGESGFDIAVGFLNSSSYFERKHQ